MADPRWPVFLTAENVSPMSLNKAFVLLDDFVNTDPVVKNPWVLVTSPTMLDQKPEPSIPPLNPALISENLFAGHSPIEINKFVRSHEMGLVSVGLKARNWLIIDQRGIEMDSCLVFDQIYDTEMERSYSFRSVYVPYIYVVDMICSLDNSRRLFHYWAYTERGTGEEGSNQRTFGLEGSDEGSKRASKASSALMRMQELGNVD